jgi:hypothetical protein
VDLGDPTFKRASSSARGGGLRASQGIKPGPANAEHAAQQRDRVLGLLRRDEPENHRPVSLSLAKKAAVFQDVELLGED